MLDQMNDGIGKIWSRMILAIENGRLCDGT